MVLSDAVEGEPAALAAQGFQEVHDLAGVVETVGESSELFGRNPPNIGMIVPFQGSIVLSPMSTSGAPG